MRDQTAPTWPAGSVLNLTEISVRQATLSWPVAHDNVGVVGYRIYSEERLLLETPPEAHSARLRALTPGARYLLRVEAFDSEGNESDSGLLSELLLRGLETVPSDEEVMSSLSDHCQECHRPWFLSIDDFRARFMPLESARVGRPLLSGGDPDGSLLIEFLEARAPDAFVYQQMPPDDDFAASSASYSELSDAGLTEVTVQQIRDWIELLGDEP